LAWFIDRKKDRKKAPSWHGSSSQPGSSYQGLDGDHAPVTDTDGDKNAGLSPRTAKSKIASAQVSSTATNTAALPRHGVVATGVEGSGEAAT